MTLKNFPLDILTISEVSDRIKLKDSEATKKWCGTHDVIVHKFSNRDYVYKIDLEYTIGKPFVSDLKIKHPENWKCLLKDILGNDALYHIFLSNLSEPRNGEALTIVKPMNKKEEEMYKQLIA